MTLQEYENAVKRLWRGNLSMDSLRDLFIVTAGLGGETGEALEHLKKYVRDGKLNHNELDLELGDVLYYLTCICLMTGTDLERVMEANIEKLEKRAAKRKTTTPYNDPRGIPCPV